MREREGNRSKHAEKEITDLNQRTKQFEGVGNLIVSDDDQYVLLEDRVRLVVLYSLER